jgi:hypothetical protein
MRTQAVFGRWGAILAPHQFSNVIHCSRSFGKYESQTLHAPPAICGWGFFQSLHQLPLMPLKLPYKVSRRSGQVDYSRTTEFYEKTRRNALEGDRKAQREAARQAEGWSQGSTVLMEALHNGTPIIIRDFDAKVAMKAWEELTG